MTALRLTRTEAAKIAAETRVSRALASKLPPVIKFKRTPGRRATVFDEVTRTCKPGYTVVRIDQKQAWVNCGSRISQISITHVIPDPHDIDDV